MFELGDGRAGAGGEGGRRITCETFFCFFFGPPLSLTWVIGFLLPRCPLSIY